MLYESPKEAQETHLLQTGFPQISAVNQEDKYKRGSCTKMVGK